MALIRWQPFGDIERIFDHVFDLPRIGLDLAADVYEEGGNVIAEMAVPGIDPKNIEISVEGDLLTVTGSREQKEEKKGKNYYSKEIRRGSFERSIRLPKAVTAEKTKASYQDGVLRVTMPAKPGAKSQKVKVEVTKGGK